MNNIREIPILSTVRGNLQEDGAVEELAQDLINDLNMVALQWNETIYPLVATLPGGPIRKIRADRSATIDPVANGLDGSQVFLDQTSRPEEYNGLLHTGLRPKTIKEVLLEVYQGILARQNAIENLLENVSGAAETYDDSQLRSWILKLAAETWDPNEIALGATLNTGNFTGAPVKGSTYSLNTRDKNLRNLLGVESESLGLTAINTLLVGANYISADTDVIAALLTLDDTISGMGGTVSLQDAYDNSADGAKRIDQSVDEDPIELIAATGSDTALKIRGALQLVDDIAASPEENIIQFQPEHAGTAATGTYHLKLFAPDNTAVGNEMLRLAVNKGSSVAAADEIVELYIAKVSASTDKQRGALYIGREDVGDGGEPQLSFDSYDNGGTETARMTTPLTVFELNAVKGDLNFSWDVDFVSDGDFLLRGNTLNLEANVGDITVQTVADLNLEAADEILISTVALSGGNIIVDSNAILDIAAETGILMNATTGDITISTVDTDENSFIHVTSNGIGTGALDADRIESYFKATGSNHDIELVSDNATAVVRGEDILLTSPNSIILAADDFTFTSTDWTTGISLMDDSSRPSEGSLFHLIGDEIGKIYQITGGFANTEYQSVASSVAGLLIQTGAVKATAYAPTTKGAGATTYGSSPVAGAGKPDVDTLYKENLVKSKGKLYIDVSKIGTINSNDGGILDSFNILGNDVTGANWDGNGGLTVGFLTPMPDNDYSVTFSFSSPVGDLIMGTISELSINSTGFAVNCYRWNSGASDWDLITNVDNDFYFYFQVA